MADQREITGFPILNILRIFHSQIPAVNDLSCTYLCMNSYLLWPVDVHNLILKSQSKMADLPEFTGFPILNIRRPFHSQISGVSDQS